VKGMPILKKMGRVTDFEFHQTLTPIKKIKHLPMQKSEKLGRIFVNLQPHATKIFSVAPV